MQRYVPFLLFFAFLLAAVQPPVSLTLRPEPLPFQPREFYVADVVDARQERSAFARLVPPGGTSAQGVDLAGGTRNSFAQFVRQSWRTNPEHSELRPVTITIKEARLDETPKGPQVEGRLTLRLAFSVKREEDILPLVEYRGGARYTRPVGSQSAVEPTVRRALTDALRFLNDWVNRNVADAPALANRLVVNVVDDMQRTDARNDTVFYRPDRPLTWKDFTGEPSARSRYAAQVAPSIAYEGRSDVKNGVIHVNVLLKAYVLKSGSWAKDVALNPYSLNHEQRHFEIARLAAERFKRELHPDSLSLNDYNSNLQYRFIEAFRDMGRRQQQYDDDTNHGLNVAEQARWNARLDAELRSFGIKK